MKRIFALLFAAVLIFSLVSCGSGKGGHKGNNEITSDVELLDTAGDRISYLFAPEGFAFDEVSGDGGYNSGRNHQLFTADEEYEIEVGLIANSDSTLYDLFVNGELTKTNYNGTEIEPDEIYKLETKEELDLEVAGHKVYYLERTISGDYFTSYVVFEHTDKDGESALYGTDLWSNDSDFYSKENSIEVFGDVFGIGRKDSAVYFGKAEEEQEQEDTYGTLESVNMAYGSDKYPLTIYKPERGTIELDAEEAEDKPEFVWMSSDDFEWTIDVFGSVLYYNGVADDAFVEYYYTGELDYFAEDYAYFYADAYELGIEYGAQPVIVMEYTFAEEGYEDEEETEYFVGVEFEDTYNGEYYGDGLVGFRYYMYDEEPSPDYLASLFGEVFGNEPPAVDYWDDEDETDYFEDDEGFDTELIVGEWQELYVPQEVKFFFFASDYATYTYEGVEYEIEYSLSDDAILNIEFEDGSAYDYTVAFDGSDTMYLIDIDGNSMEFERI